MSGYSPHVARVVPHSLPPGAPRGPVQLFGALSKGPPPAICRDPLMPARPRYFLEAFSSALQRARRSPSLMAPHQAGLRVTTARQ